MSDFGSWLDISDRFASIVSAAVGVLTVILSRRKAAGGPARRVRRGRGGAMLVMGLPAVSAGVVLWSPGRFGTAARWTWPVPAILAVVVALKARPAATAPDRSSLPGLADLLTAQNSAVTHQYRFFGYHVPALSEIYVHRRASAADGQSRDRQPWVTIGDLLRRPAHLVILGGAGSGKTTVVAATVREAAREAQSGYGQRGRAGLPPRAPGTQRRRRRARRARRARGRCRHRPVGTCGAGQRDRRRRPRSRRPSAAPGPAQHAGQGRRLGGGRVGGPRDSHRRGPPRITVVSAECRPARPAS